MMSDDLTPASRSHLALRHDLHARFGPAQVGVSADGMTIDLMGPVDCGLAVGGFAVLEGVDTDDWALLAAQVGSLSIVDRDGPRLEVDTAIGTDELVVTSASVHTLLRVLRGSGAVIGSIEAGRFVRHHHVAPFGERIIRPARPDELAAIMSGLSSDRASIAIGSLRQAPDVSARLTSTGFARHTFVCGQSGSGKTYATGALLERLLTETSLPIVVLDPNSDHVHLGIARDPDDRSDETDRLRAHASSVQVARARGLGSSLVLCADYSDLTLDWQALVLQLHPIDDSDEFDALRRIAGALDEPYSLRDVIDAAMARADEEAPARRLAQRIENLGVAEWDVWRRDGEVSLAAMGLREERCVVLDLGSLSGPAERTVVALALLGHRWALRRERKPALIVIDEAHNVVPAVSDDPLLRSTTELGVLIAGEGRKFGLHLLVATQRPSKVHPNVVSQCDNLILMRMNGAGDVDDLVSLFSHVPEAMVRSSPRFALGQALIAGPITPVPMVVQVGTRRSREGGGDAPTDWVNPTPLG